MFKIRYKQKTMKIKHNQKVKYKKRGQNAVCKYCWVNSIVKLNTFHNPVYEEAKAPGQGNTVFNVYTPEQKDIQAVRFFKEIPDKFAVFYTAAGFNRAVFYSSRAFCKNPL